MLYGRRPVSAYSGITPWQYRQRCWCGPSPRSFVPAASECLPAVHQPWGWTLLHQALLSCLPMGRRTQEAEVRTACHSARPLAWMQVVLCLKYEKCSSVLRNIGNRNDARIKARGYERLKEPMFYKLAVWRVRGDAVLLYKYLQGNNINEGRELTYSLRRWQDKEPEVKEEKVRLDVRRSEQWASLGRARCSPWYRRLERCSRRDGSKEQLVSLLLMHC